MVWAPLGLHRVGVVDLEWLCSEEVTVQAVDPSQVWSMAALIGELFAAACHLAAACTFLQPPPTLELVQSSPLRWSASLQLGPAALPVAASFNSLTVLRHGHAPLAALGGAAFLPRSKLRSQERSGRSLAARVQLRQRWVGDPLATSHTGCAEICVPSLKIPRIEEQGKFKMALHSQSPHAAAVWVSRGPVPPAQGG